MLRSHARRRCRVRFVSAALSSVDRTGSRRRTAAAAMLFLALAMAPSALAGTTISLDEAISRALQFVPALDAARAQSDLGGAKEMEARAPLYPDIWANAEYNQAPGYDQIITHLGLTLSQLALNS